MRTGTRPAEVAAGVYRVVRGTGKSNVYLVRSGSSWVLIDAGWAHQGVLIKSSAELVFGVDTPPAAIVLTLLLPKTSSMLVGAVVRVGPMLYAIAVGGALVRRGGECCGMVMDRAAATGLSRHDERVRAAAAAADEQPGQGRGDPRAVPPALGSAAAARSGQGAVHPG